MSAIPVSPDHRTLTHKLQQHRRWVLTRGRNGTRAVFRKQRLLWTNLGNQSLQGADFSAADLRRADLRAAELSGADFTAADLRGTDLRGAKGLTADQLRGAASLFGALLDASLKLSISMKCPHLFRESTPETAGRDPSEEEDLDALLDGLDEVEELPEPEELEEFEEEEDATPLPGVIPQLDAPQPRSLRPMKDGLRRSDARGPKRGSGLRQLGSRPKGKSPK